MNIVAFIPARKNSVRFKNKHFRVLGDKPLINWTLEFSKKLNFINHVLISSNDNKILKIGKNFKVPNLGIRPEKFSQSNTSSAKTILYEISKYEKKFSKIDIIILLQPTSPFRSKRSIEKALGIFCKNNFKKSVVSCYKKKLNKVPNGNFYITSPSLIKKENAFFSEKSIFYDQIYKKYNVDIDTLSDLMDAKKFI